MLANTKVANDLVKSQNFFENQKEEVGAKSIQKEEGISFTFRPPEGVVAGKK